MVYMSARLSSSVRLPLFALSLASLVNLLWPTGSWGQSAAGSTVTTQIPKQRQPREVLQLHQLEQYSTNAADLLLACDDNLSKSSLTLKPCHNPHTKQLVQTDSPPKNEDEGSILQPTKDRLRINFGEENPRSFTFGFGSRIGEPTALQGERDNGLSRHPPKDWRLFPLVSFSSKG